jgi:hypothetical protein
MLMLDYYQRLIKGEGRSTVLREGQQAVIANPATRHPYCFHPHRELDEVKGTGAAENNR